jgi:hypothetical protein
MKRAALVLIGALALALPAAAAEPPVTLVADKRIADARPVLLSGAVTSGREGEEVVLESKECGAPGWIAFRRERTDARGSWHTSVSPGIRTSYRARWKDARTSAVEVLTRPTIRFDQKGRTRYSVWMFALRFFDGAKGRMERFDRSRGGWVLGRRVTLRRLSAPRGATWAYSGAEFSARVRVGTLVRFVLPRDQAAPCYLAGYSIQFNVR